jgi:4-amino-4-deoxy-L-arabinose transferase-like glycosyltransferase
MKKIPALLIIIFILAVGIRFLWFPGNVYFGFDQARDAFVSQQIYQNHDLKIIGPSAARGGLYHGPSYWYLIGPIYLLFKGNPAGPLGFLSLINALGVFLIFYLGKILFNRKTALLASLLYAFSFAQTQYAMYFGNPAPAVLTIMLFYLGWLFLIFRKNSWGWVLIGLNLGLSIQFEFFLIYLFAAMVLFLIFFRKEIKESFRWKSFGWGLLAFVFAISNFILAEFKFGFKTTKTLLSVFLPGQTPPAVKLATSTFTERLGQEVLYNLFNFWPRIREFLAIALILTLLFFLIRKTKLRKQMGFLLIWLGSNLFLDFFGPPQLYYVSIGLSVGVILFAAWLLMEAFNFKKIVFFFFLTIILLSNSLLIFRQNPKGSMKELYVQEDMMLKDEKKVLDKIYQDAAGKPFIINALMMPYKIKTTWAYLFNWYGQKKYGYLPFWGGEDVPGYPGNLPKSTSLKKPRYAIIEPKRGIPQNLQQEFLDSENGYSYPVWETKIGDFVIQKRQ